LISPLSENSEKVIVHVEAVLVLVLVVVLVLDCLKNSALWLANAARREAVLPFHALEVAA
jgi:hypothetical protein